MYISALTNESQDLLHDETKIVFVTSWENQLILKFMFSKKATKFDKIFTVDLTLTKYCQIDGEDFVNFCGLLRKYKL